MAFGWISTTNSNPQNDKPQFEQRSNPQKEMSLLYGNMTKSRGSLVTAYLM